MARSRHVFHVYANVPRGPAGTWPREAGPWGEREQEGSTGVRAQGPPAWPLWDPKDTGHGRRRTLRNHGKLLAWEAAVSGGLSGFPEEGQPGHRILMESGWLGLVGRVPGPERRGCPRSQPACGAHGARTARELGEGQKDQGQPASCRVLPASALCTPAGDTGRRGPSMRSKMLTSLRGCPRCHGRLPEPPRCGLPAMWDLFWPPCLVGDRAAPHAAVA